MTLDAWARLVTSEVRDRLPDVRAVMGRKAITWTLGRSVATLDARTEFWWLRTGGALTFREQHDAATAHVAAQNIVSHFA